MTYQEYKNKRQEEFNALPLFFAYGIDQFEAAMKARGLTADDTDKIYMLQSGCYYLRSDADVIRAYFKKPDPLRELMKDPDFAEDAFYYEMCNHEYGINWQGDWDVCSCFGNVEYDSEKGCIDYLEELGYGREIQFAYCRARTRYNQDALDNDWF